MDFVNLWSAVLYTALALQRRLTVMDKNELLAC